MSLRWNWDSPTPSLASECAPLPRSKGERARSPADEGKSLALCLLCANKELFAGLQQGGKKESTVFCETVHSL
jgi:hypothetical protein